MSHPGINARAFQCHLGCRVNTSPPTCSPHYRHSNVLVPSHCSKGAEPSTTCPTDRTPELRQGVLSVRPVVKCSEEIGDAKILRHAQLLAFRVVLGTWLMPGSSCADVIDLAATGVTPYVPSPVEVGWEIWVGAAAGVIPFIIGAYEFGKRILIQQRCEVCKGSGLLPWNRNGVMTVKKCRQCGGFFPWTGWKQFLSTTADPGNGGPLLQPKGQTSVFYTVPPPRPETSKRPESNTPVIDTATKDEALASNTKKASEE